jgi:hypothetical protein
LDRSSSRGGKLRYLEVEGIQKRMITFNVGVLVQVLKRSPLRTTPATCEGTESTFMAHKLRSRLIKSSRVDNSPLNSDFLCNKKTLLNTLTHISHIKEHLLHLTVIEVVASEERRP